MDRKGEVGRILIYFDLELSPSVSLSTKPEIADGRGVESRQRAILLRARLHNLLSAAIDR